MKHIFVIPALSLCVSCTSSVQPPDHSAFRPSSVPIVTMQYEAQVQQMSRTEVINAVHTCQASGLRAEVINGKRMINGYITSIPVDVVCLPKMDPFKW